MNTQLDFSRFFPCVLQAVATDDFQVYVYFNDGSVRLLDVKPLLQPCGKCSMLYQLLRCAFGHNDLIHALMLRHGVPPSRPAPS